MQTNVNSPSMETPASVNSGVYQTAPPGGFWENVTLQIRSTDRSCVSTEQTRRWGYVRVLYNSLWGQKSVSFLADRRDVCLISIQICSLFFFSSWWNRHWQWLVPFKRNPRAQSLWSGSVGQLGSLLVALGALHAVGADDARGPMEVEHHDELLSLWFQLLDLRLQPRVQHLQPLRLLRGTSKKRSLNYTASHHTHLDYSITVL